MSAVLFPYWFNGSLRDAAEICLSPIDRGYLLGDGAFETLAVFNGTAIDAQLHVNRLLAASETLGLDLSRSEIDSALSAVLLAHPAVNAIMRITASRGVGSRGLAAAQGPAVLLVTLVPWTTGTLFRPVSLVTSSIRRNQSSPSARLKLTSYADNILAAREAQAAGADDALLLNGHGRVVCSTIANLFIVLDGVVLTPPVQEGALPGTIRMHIAAMERPLSLSDVMVAEAVFLTNSLRIVRPVVSLEGSPLSTSASDHIARIFDEQCRRFKDQCGVDPRSID